MEFSSSDNTMFGEDKSEDIDITNVDESEEKSESQYFPYDPGDYL